MNSAFDFEPDRLEKTEERLFDPDGAVAIYDTPPDGEAPPVYASPVGGS